MGVGFPIALQVNEVFPPSTAIIVSGGDWTMVGAAINRNYLLTVTIKTNLFAIILQQPISSEKSLQSGMRSQRKSFGIHWLLSEHIYSSYRQIMWLLLCSKSSQQKRRSKVMQWAKQMANRESNYRNDVHQSHLSSLENRHISKSSVYIFR